MNRSSKKYRLNSQNQHQSNSCNAKQLLKMSSSLLKDFLNKNQQTYLQSKNRRYYQLNKALDSTSASSANVDLTGQVSKKIQQDNLQEITKKNTLKMGYRQRHSHRILENRNLRQNQDLKCGLQRTSKQKTAQNGMKVSTSREHEFKITQKWQQITVNRSNIFKRKVNGSLQHKTSMPAKKEKIFQSTQYYIDDIKSSVAQFVKNQEFNNAHLTHLMESLSTFKMFTYSYLPKHPHKIFGLPLIEPDKLTLVFDLDQTLIHSQVIDWEAEEDELDWGEIVEINAPEVKYKVNLKIRPHAAKVLRRLKQHFQIGLFTAAQEHYASQLIKVLDPQNTLFSFKLFRPHCQQMHSRVSYIKDLRVIGNRDLSKIVLIDNSPQSYLFQKSNGVPITSFYNERQDEQLLKLQKFLMQMVKIQDVRPVLQDYFKMQKYSRFNSLGKLVDQLY